MNVFEIAKKMEKDGITMYQEELLKTQDEGLRTILNLFINQEKKHYNLFDAMEKETNLEFQKDDLLEVKNVFQQLKEKGDFLPKDQLEFYNKALEIEIKSEGMYKDMADQEINEQNKKIILDIANEEHKHIVFIQNIINLVENADSWVEDAEFNHIDEY
jgi:rubrerythrin